MPWTQIPGSSVTAESFAELDLESARSAAIVGAAIVEDSMTRVIAHKLPVEGGTKKSLMKPSGPLGTFDTKAKLLYAMGIVSKDALHDLYRIGEIRNKFAHRLDINDFHHADIFHHCMEFALIEKYAFEMGTPSDQTDGLWINIQFENLAEKLLSPRHRFYLTVFLLHAIEEDLPRLGTPRASDPVPLF